MSRGISIEKSIFNTPCNVFLYSFGQKFQKDLTSLTDIQPFYDSCRHILNGNLDFRQKIDTIPKFTTLKEPFNVKLIDYIMEKPQNRIKFIKKFYKEFYPNTLYLMILDIDIIYNTNIKSIFKFKGNRAFVNKKELYKVLVCCFPDEW